MKKVLFLLLLLPFLGYSQDVKIPQKQIKDLPADLANRIVMPIGPSFGQLLRYDGAAWNNWTPNFLTSIPTWQQTLNVDNTGDQFIINSFGNSWFVNGYGIFKNGGAQDFEINAGAGSAIGIRSNNNSYRTRIDGSTLTANRIIIMRDLDGTVAYLSDIPSLAGYWQYSDTTSVLASKAWANGQYPLKSGSGATGTWSIGISGNAATVTNGVYTNGSYANPAWITSLAWSKIIGAPSFLTSVDSATFATRYWTNSSFSLLGHTHTFASLTSKPTTLVGYGITDAANITHTHNASDINAGVLNIARIPTIPYANISGTPTIPTVNNATLTLATSGIATGSETFTANSSTNKTFTVNIPSTLSSYTNDAGFLNYIPTWQQTLTANNTGSSFFISSFGNTWEANGYGIFKGTGRFEINANSGAYISIRSNNNNYYTQFDGSALTVNRTVTMRNLDGTMAYLSDIPSLSGYWQYSDTTLVLASKAWANGQYPLKNGTGASGTWSIGISGNAATVTNGVYTNGSYANPSWLTSLPWSKITGAPSFLTANQSITVTASGDATGSGSGATSISLPLQIAAGVIVNADINASAGITLSKLAAMTANRVVISDGSGFLTASSITNTTLSYLDATSSIQTQLNSKVSGSIANQQVAVGSGSSISGSAALMFDGNILTAKSSASFTGLMAENTLATGEGYVGARNNAGDAITLEMFGTIATVPRSSLIANTGLGGMQFLQYNNTGNISFSTTTSATPRMTILNAGNVGIGTGSPTSSLQVEKSLGSYNPVLRVENLGSASVDFKNVALFIGNRGSASDIDDNTNIGIWQKSNISGNYGTVNFFNATGNLAAFVGAKYTNHLGGGQSSDFVIGTTNLGTSSTKATIKANGDAEFSGSVKQSGVTSALVKADASGKLVAAVAGTDYSLASGGSYTPTLTWAVSGTPVSLASSGFTYARNGDIVTVSGLINTGSAAVGGNIILVSLPIASNLTSDYQLTGTVSGANLTNVQNYVVGDGATDVAKVIFTSSSTGVIVAFTFQYIVQ